MQIDKDLIEKFVKKARNLTYDMHSRLSRLPDFADFRAAFNEILDEKQPQNTDQCQAFYGADDVCGLPKLSPIHTNYKNPMRHDFVGNK